MCSGCLAASHRRAARRARAAAIGARVLCAVAGAATIAGCEAPLSALDPAGPAAGSIATLWWIMLRGALSLFVLVLVLFALAWRYPGALSRIAGRHWIVGGGLLMPVTILAALVFAALVQGERLLARPGEPGVLQVRVMASQWQWAFAYPDQPGLEPEPNLLRIPAGRPVDLFVTSSDVIHSIWIPRLAGKIDAIPGRVNVVRLMADAPGRYAGNCAEYCGIGHATMHFEVVAYEPAEGAPATEQRP